MLITEDSLSTVTSQLDLKHYMKAMQNIFYAHGFGKVAPWVDLANSEEWDGFGKRTDHLSDPEWLAAFLKHWKLASILRGKSSRLPLAKLRELLRPRRAKNDHGTWRWTPAKSPS